VFVEDNNVGTDAGCDEIDVGLTAMSPNLTWINEQIPSQWSLCFDRVQSPWQTGEFWPRARVPSYQDLCCPDCLSPLELSEPSTPANLAANADAMPQRSVEAGGGY
jgi:hypothetical protein